MGKKFFISIPITGQEEKAKELCKEYKEKLTGLYPSCEFITPFEVATEKDMPDSYYMGKDIEKLMECDAIASAEGWQKSKGCQVERFTANIYGLDIFDIEKMLDNANKEAKKKAKYIVADFGVRYFEDANLNGKEDDGDNPKMPCIQGERWVIKVDIENGLITNWEKGNRAVIFYKVCDDGKYCILDCEGNVLEEFESYVPSIFAIDDSGFGDYVYLTINEEGFIKSWSCTPKDIEEMLKNSFVR